MAALPQCDAYGLIHDPDGGPDVDKLVIVLKVIDASGNPISFEQRQTFTDDTGTFHFTLPQNAKVTLTARASGIFAGDNPVTFTVPAAPTGELILSFPPTDLIVTPPLTWSGNTLRILQANSTQDGYLSAGDYVKFNSFSAGSKVTSFNSRSGDVLPIANDYQSFYLGLGGGTLTGPLLLNADPTTALGAATRNYVDAKFASGIAGVATFNGRTGAVLPIVGDYSSFYLGLGGGTLTGPLTLAADPVAPLQAATKQYVDAAGTNLPATWLAADFKASGSAAKFTGGIPAASATLTLTAAGDFAVGQGIYVTGAGPSGAALLTKVDAIDATKKIITLHDLSSTAQPSTNVQHDDTVALQTAIDTVFNANGGELIVAPGFYRVNGPFNSIKSILRVPYSPVSGGPIIGITIKGMAASFPAFVGPQSTGVIIQTDRVAPDNTYAIFAVALSDNTTDFSTPNNIFLTLEGICFRTYDNPNINGLDLVMCGMCWLKNITVDAGVTQLSGSQPTHNTFGVRLPRANTAGNTVTESVFVTNYAVGFVASEIWCSFGTNGAIRCLIAYQLDFGWHVTGGPTRLTAYQCPTVIKVINSICIDLFLNYENDAPGAGWWADAGTDLYDPSNLARGLLRVCKIRSGAGTRIQATKNGFANVSIIDLSGAGWQIPDPLVLAGKLVSVGINDSGGPGYALLRVPNSGADVTAPVISGVSSGSPTSTGANISWTTNEAADSQVEWGTTTAYGTLTPATPADAVPPGVTSHSVPLTGLTVATLYHFRVKSKDASGNMATSSDFTFTTAASSTLLTGLVSYWKMDESTASATRVDSHTGGNNLVPDGGTAPPVDTIGRIGNAVKTASFERMVAAHQANQNSSGSMTISAWIKVHTLAGVDGNGLHTVLSKSSTTTDDAYFLGYRNSSPGPQWSFVVTSDGNTATTGVNCAVAATPTLDQWYHLVAIYDHTATPKQLRLRVNDGAIGSQTTNFTGPIFASTAPLYALVQIVTSAYFGANSIDEVGLWNRALTLSEITALYNGGAGLPYSSF